MKYKLFLALGAAAFAGGACGDNSKVCGPGTADSDGDGLCEPSDVPPMCSNGTVLDQATNSCVIDPNSCQNGTVLIGNQCVDPTEGLVVDLTEGTEPNGLGIIESSNMPAGQIVLKPQGQTFVVKGNINPFQDDDADGEIDPDMDTYVVLVDAPTLVEISVDGVNGLMGAFIGLTFQGEPAEGWLRYGMNVTGDTSKRKIFFPAAGAYALVVGDTRSMYLDGDSPPAAGAGGASGGPDANYFMSLTVLPTPAPTPLSVAGGAGSVVDTLAPGEVKFYSAPMGAGFNSIEVDMPGTPSAALVVTRNGDFRAHAAESFDFFTGPIPAAVYAGGFRATDQTTLVADAVFHFGPEATPFTLDVVLGDAGQLSTSGGTVSQPESATDFTAFYYDVASANEVTGMAIAFNQPVSGVITDQDLFIVARLTYDPSSGFTDRTIEGYTGLLRHRAPGRYYFLTLDQYDDGPTDIVATSTYAAQTTATVVKGTPLANQAVSTTYRSKGFVYEAGAGDPWQTFLATGTGTGAVTNVYYPRSTAYGRLSPLVSDGFDSIVDDVAPLFTNTFTEGDLRARGHVLLDDSTTSYFVTSTIAADTGTPTVTLDFRTRPHHDFGALATGTSAARAGETLDADTAALYYLVRATNGAKLEMRANPVTDTLDTRVQTLSRNDDVTRSINNAPAGGEDIAQLIQSGSGWTAFSVSSATPLTAAASFDLNVSSSVFVAPTYARAAGTTAYANACTDGTTQALTSDGTGNGPANDEGFTGVINGPSGFNFFGFLEPQLIASTNGWLTFGGVTSALYTNLNMPTAAAPNALVAPFWDDLANVVICTRTIGTKLVVQWTGTLYGSSTAVQFQAILDGATSTVEFVYGSGHVPNGSTATVGIEDQVGGSANRVGFNTANTTPAGSAILFTPN